MNIGLLILAASWLVRDHFGPWNSFHSEFLAFVGLATIMLGCLRGVTRSATAPIIMLPVLVVAAIPWLQFALGITYFAGDAVVSTLFLAGFGFSIWVGFYLSNPVLPQKPGNAIAFAIAMPALISAAIGWYQWFDIDGMFVQFVMPSASGLATGNISQPNLLGTFLLMGLFAFTYLLHLRAIGRGTFLLVVIFISAAIAMTQSRAAIVGALVLGLFLAVNKRHYLPTLSTWSVGGWFLGLVCARVALPHVASLLFLPSGGVAMSLVASNGRFAIWEQVLSAIFQAPWLGYGWNQTFRAQTVGALIHPNEITYTYAHNVVLDLLAWNGIPLGLLIVVAFVVWLAARVLTIKTPASIFAMGALLPIVAQSLFEFPFAYANFLLTAGLLIGVIEANHVTTRRFVVRAEVIAVLGAVYLVVGVMAALEYVRVEEDYRIVRFENLRIGDTPSDYEVPHFQLLTHMGAMLDAARTAPAPGMSAAQIENLREASHRFPYGLLMYKYAVARALNGDPEGGIGQMQELKAIYGEKYYRQSKGAFYLATQLQLP